MSFEYDMWSCEWRGPWEQNAYLGAGGALQGSGARIRLVGKTKNFETIGKATSRNAFFTTPVPVVRLLAVAEPVPGATAVQDDAKFLEAMVRHFHPDLTCTDIYAFLIRRAQDISKQEKLMSDDDFMELLEKSDREKVKAEESDRRQRNIARAKFLQSLAPLKAKVHAEQAELNQAMRSEARERGPVHYEAGADDTWTVELVRQWLPPQSTVVQDWIGDRF